jgi:hypothetical protein
MYRWNWSLAIVIAMVAAGVLAGNVTSTSAARGGDGRCACPGCGTVCCPRVERGSEKKHCWEVECEEICVPAIRWPWLPCCEPLKCGYTRTVRKLKKVEYECPVCKYTWESSQPTCQQPAVEKAEAAAASQRRGYVAAPLLQRLPLDD